MGARSMESRLRQRQDPGHPRTFRNLPEPHPPYLPGRQENRGLEQGRGEGGRDRDGLCPEETGGRCPRSALRRKRGQEPGLGEEGCVVGVGPRQDLEPRSPKADSLHTNVD